MFWVGCSSSGMWDWLGGGQGGPILVQSGSQDLYRSGLEYSMLIHMAVDPAVVAMVLYVCGIMIIVGGPSC